MKGAKEENRNDAKNNGHFIVVKEIHNQKLEVKLPGVIKQTIIILKVIDTNAATCPFVWSLPVQYLAFIPNVVG